MNTKKKKEITNKDLLNFMGGIAEDITDLRKEMRSEFADVRKEMRSEFADVRKEMATKHDLKELRRELLDEVKEVKKELKALSNRTDEDDRAIAHTVIDLQKRVDYLENQLKTLKAG